MTQTPQTPAGWYPQGNVERWWDGNAWSEHTRPLGGQPQPTMQQPVYGSPQTYYPTEPPKQSHTGRNILIVIGVLFLLLVGGCVAAGVLITNKVNDVVNDDSPGGPNNPITIEPGEAFEVRDFDYAAGWSVEADASGVMAVKNLKVTNNRDEASRAIVDIKLYLNNEVLASANCNNGVDKIPEGVTVTLTCTSTATMPADYDKVTINDTI